jgi:uncharacterized phage protein (TIGR02218 family)
MTFAANETGQGSPIELYHFQRGLENWYYTSYDDDVVFSSNTYLSTQIGRSDIEWQQEIEKSEITVSVPRNNTMIAPYVVYPPTEIMLLTIYREHFYDGDSEYLLYWQGRMLNVEFKGSIADMTCETTFTSMKRPGLRRKHTPQCPHVLYGGKCGLNDQTFRVNGSLVDSTGVTISSVQWGTYPDGYFTGGRVVYDTYQRRDILDHTGNILTLNAPLEGAIPGQSVAAYPGCAHNLSDCTNKFNNVINYGGFPYFGPNPFNGKTLF